MAPMARLPPRKVEQLLIEGPFAIGRTMGYRRKQHDELTVDRARMHLPDHLCAAHHAGDVLTEQASVADRLATAIPAGDPGRHQAGLFLALERLTGISAPPGGLSRLPQHRVPAPHPARRQDPRPLR